MEKARRARANRTQMQRARAAAQDDGSAVLRHASVSPATLKNYKQAVQHFETFAVQRRWSLKPPHLCLSLEKYLWHHANRGFCSALGRHAFYGWLHLRFPTKSVEGNLLMNAREALCGWRKLHGDDSRDPLPEEIYLAVVRRLITTRKVMSAVFCQPQLYLRPSELLALRPEDVLLPERGAGRYRSVGVVVAPRELEVTTKARSHDDTVLVDEHCQATLGPVLAELVRVRAAEEHLFPLTLNAYEKTLRESGIALGLTTEFVPHSLRHCGPANDLFHGRRGMAALAKRGRWANLKSVQRNGKSGRLVEVWRQVSKRDRARWTLDAPGTGSLLLAALRHLPAGYRGQWPSCTQSDDTYRDPAASERSSSSRYLGLSPVPLPQSSSRLASLGSVCCLLTSSDPYHGTLSEVQDMGAAQLSFPALQLPVS